MPTTFPEHIQFFIKRRQPGQRRRLGLRELPAALLAGIRLQLQGNPGRPGGILHYCLRKGSAYLYLLRSSHNPRRIRGFARPGVCHVQSESLGSLGEQEHPDQQVNRSM